MCLPLPLFICLVCCLCGDHVSYIVKRWEFVCLSSLQPLVKSSLFPSPGFGLLFLFRGESSCLSLKAGKWCCRQLVSEFSPPWNSNFSGHSSKFGVKKNKNIGCSFIAGLKSFWWAGESFCAFSTGQGQSGSPNILINTCKTLRFLSRECAVVDVCGMWQTSWVALEGRPGWFLVPLWYVVGKGWVWQW